MAGGPHEAGSEPRRVPDRSADEGHRFAQAVKSQEIGPQAEVSPKPRPSLDSAPNKLLADAELHTGVLVLLGGRRWLAAGGLMRKYTFSHQLPTHWAEIDKKANFKSSL